MGAVVNEAGGYLACMAIKLVSTTLAFVYLVFFVKNVKGSGAVAAGEDTTTPSRGRDWRRGVKEFLSTALSSTWQMVKAIFRRRNKNLRMLVLIQIFNYSLYIFTVADDIFLPIVYQFLKYKFNTSSSEYAYLLTLIMASFVVGLLVVVPLASKVLKVSDR